MEWLKENLDLIAYLISAVGGLDVIAGYLPAKWVPYVGLIRRIVEALKKRK
jgi:hypothetical protein